MEDSEKTREQLLSELVDLRRRTAELEALETERRQSEEALKKSYKRYKDLADLLPQAVFETNEVGNITFANHIIFERSGYTPEDVDKGMNGLQLIIPEDRDRFSESMSGVMRGEEPSGIEITALNKDGSQFSAIAFTAPIINGDKPVGIRGIVVDIAEREQADKKVQELYQKEASLRQELEAEIEKRVQFTRTLVHELKTPLTPMIAASDLLMEESPDGPLFRLARSINQGAETLGKRIDALLDAAKGELGILELVRTETDLLDLLHRIAEDITPLAYSRNQVLSVKLPASLPKVLIDGERLRQVVVNLLDNSFKFTPEEGKITLRAEKKGDAIIVEVEDTGSGIPVDQQKHLFEASYHIESQSQHGRGLGLGLALSKLLVELHGGKIWAESQEGKGSKFGFSMPLGSSPS
ncbi:ATP-binding protein [Chloroflexota bacterium]